MEGILSTDKPMMQSHKNTMTTLKNKAQTFQLLIKKHSDDGVL
jgi:hypothetical protein